MTLVVGILFNILLGLSENRECIPNQVNLSEYSIKSIRVDEIL